MFIKLLCRLYDPTESEILLDIREYEYREYMSVMSTFLQRRGRNFFNVVMIVNYKKESYCQNNYFDYNYIYDKQKCKRIS